MPTRQRRRGVAQAGSAPGLGPGGRRFESCLPDHIPLSTDQLGSAVHWRSNRHPLSLRSEPVVVLEVMAPSAARRWSEKIPQTWAEP